MTTSHDLSSELTTNWRNKNYDLTTECCVDCTVRDAFHLDYHVFVASDACAAYEAEVHEASLKALELNCAILVDTDQVITAWEEAA